MDPHQPPIIIEERTSGTSAISRCAVPQVGVVHLEEAIVVKRELDRRCARVTDDEDAGGASDRQLLREHRVRGFAWCGGTLQRDYRGVFRPRWRFPHDLAAHACLLQRFKGELTLVQIERRMMGMIEDITSP